jgi:hypothetical protein
MEPAVLPRCLASQFTVCFLSSSKHYAPGHRHVPVAALIGAVAPHRTRTRTHLPCGDVCMAVLQELALLWKTAARW